MNSCFTVGGAVSGIVDRNEAAVLPQTSQDVVSGYPKQKGVNRSFQLVIFISSSHQHHEDFLSHIFSNVGNTCHVQSKPVNVALTAAVKLRECFFVSAEHCLDEFAVSGLRRHCSNRCYHN